MPALSPSGRHQAGQRLRLGEWSLSRSGLPRRNGAPCHPAMIRISTSAAASLISTRGDSGAAACQRGQRFVAPTRGKVEVLRPRPAQGGQATDQVSHPKTPAHDEFHSQCRAAWRVAARLHECSCLAACVEGFATAWAAALAGPLARRMRAMKLKGQVAICNRRRSGDRRNVRQDSCRSGRNRGRRRYRRRTCRTSGQSLAAHQHRPLAIRG
jgi:hypothetical protein